MPFPESKRVLYEKNPLDEVVCQLRFPPILRIDTEAPAAFQERVRQAFPMYQRASAPAPLGLPFPAELMRALASAGVAAHEFLSADGVWKLSLSRDFIALTTTKYKAWSDFKSKLREPLEALTSLYAPAFFIRVGLRYRDRIDREKLGLRDTPWRELLRPEALGELGDERIGPHVAHILREVLVRLSDDAGQVRVVHGLQRDGERLAYIIDSDFFTDKQTDTKAVGDALDAFNRRAGHLFRWYISTALHEAMDPRDPPNT